MSDRRLRVGLDLDGNDIDIEADEYLGRIFQHEVDHLDGHLLIDRLDDDQRKAAKRTLRKMRISLSPGDPDGLHQLLGE